MQACRPGRCRAAQVLPLVAAHVRPSGRRADDWGAPGGGPAAPPVSNGSAVAADGANGRAKAALGSELEVGGLSLDAEALAGDAGDASTGEEDDGEEEEDDEEELDDEDDDEMADLDEELLPAGGCAAGLLGLLG